MLDFIGADSILKDGRLRIRSHNNEPLEIIKESKVLNESYFGGEISKGVDNNDFKITKSDFAWVRSNNDYFISQKPNTDSIPSGLYDIRYNDRQGVYLERRSVTLDELFIMPEDNMQLVINDLEKFWSLEDKYKEYQIIYKRGILMHGKQGTGKTSLINLLIQRLVTEHDGIVINGDDVNLMINMLHNLRSLESEKPIMVLIEDLDSFLDYNSEKSFLNLLDGNVQIDNVIYLASTNYLDRIKPRIKNRPSRFNLVLNIAPPNDESRRVYIERKLKEEDLAKIKIDQWVNDTKGFTFDHIKDLVVSVAIMGNDYNTSLEKLKKMDEYGDR